MKTKICTICNQEKPLQLFSKKRTAYNSVCKSCDSLRFKEHYKTHKQYYINKARQTEQELKKYILKYKSDKACSICGYNHNTNILQFHHTTPANKSNDVTKLTKQGSLSKIKLEIDKCILLCPNCHMDLHEKTGWVAQGEQGVL